MPIVMPSIVDDLCPLRRWLIPILWILDREHRRIPACRFRTLRKAPKTASFIGIMRGEPFFVLSRLTFEVDVSSMRACTSLRAASPSRERDGEFGFVLRKTFPNGFRNAYVFDIAQTDGVELPELHQVSGDPRENVERLASFVRSKGIQLVYNQNIAPALGMSYGGRIAILPGQSKAEEFSTLVAAMSVEALTTSEIEGEMLNRASVQSSIQRQLGLLSDRRKVQPAEQGISELMVTLYRGVDEVLTEDHLFSWHRMIAAGRGDLRDVGRYRTSDEPMQVVSGASYAPKVHFEAPPSNRVRKEMARFVEWFNRTAPGTDSALPALTRAGVAHLYFESIHPFEDGNGRI